MKKHSRQTNKRGKNIKNQKKSFSTAWRQFENLVTRIEQVLAPHDAIIASPDFFIDKITGAKREVDASIKFKAGTAEIVIIIECRDRVKIEDSTWIEQLATKQRNIGASKVIAVTSNSFTIPAIKKAQHYGIELRKVNKINEDAIVKWSTLKGVFEKYHVVNYELKFAMEENQKDKLIKELEIYENKLFDSDFLTSYNSRNKITLRNILEDFLRRGLKEIDKKVSIPEKGHSEEIKLRISLPTNQIYITTSFGKFDLIGLNVGFTLYNGEEIAFKPLSKFTYSDQDKDLYSGVEFEMTSSNGSKDLVTIHTNLNKGIKHITIWKDDETKI